MTVGQLIRRRRQNLGWSQRVLAERTGLPRSLVNKIENGRVQIGRDRMRYFANVPELGLTVDQLWLLRLLEEKRRLEAEINEIEGSAA